MFVGPDLGLGKDDKISTSMHIVNASIFAYIFQPIHHFDMTANIYSSISYGKHKKKLMTSMTQYTTFHN